MMVFHPISANNIQLPTPDTLWSSWNWTWEIQITLPLAISLIWYLAGMIRRGDIARLRWRHLSFLSGWLALCAALISPLHRLGDVLFSAHMLQHEILILVAAPLFSVAHPAVTFLYAFPLKQRRAIGHTLSSVEHNLFVGLLFTPLMAWLGHAAALWLWHIPALYQETLYSELIHALQHLSFFVTALIFWSALYGAGRGKISYGASVFYVFGTAVHSGALGALLTFSTILWYPLYAGRTAVWGLTPLEDQQLGGLIMWVPSSIVFIIVGLALFARWLQESNKRFTQHAIFADRTTFKS